MIWNQASHKQRTYKTRVYKPVDPVGTKLSYFNEQGDDEHRWLSAKGNVMDAISCAGGCGYHICSKTGPCTPKPPVALPSGSGYSRIRPLGFESGLMAETAYRDLCTEMQRVAPNSWFFQVPKDLALECIEKSILKHGPGFRSIKAKLELSEDLRKLVGTKVGPCTACGRRNTQLAGRVCADMQSCDLRIQAHRQSTAFCAPRLSGA